MSNVETVGTWGTFDGELHPGHLAFLGKCSSYGEVTVLLSPDDYVKTRKKRSPIYPRNVRENNLLETGLVHRIIYGTLDEAQNIRLILELQPDIFCFGGDQNNDEDRQLEQELTRIGATSMHIPRTGEYSTTTLYFSD